MAFVLVVGRVGVGRHAAAGGHEEPRRIRNRVQLGRQRERVGLLLGLGVRPPPFEARHRPGRVAGGGVEPAELILAAEVGWVERHDLPEQGARAVGLGRAHVVVRGGPECGGVAGELGGDLFPRPAGRLVVLVGFFQRRQFGEVFRGALAGESDEAALVGDGIGGFSQPFRFGDQRAQRRRWIGRGVVRAGEQAVSLAPLAGRAAEFGHGRHRKVVQRLPGKPGLVRRAQPVLQPVAAAKDDQFAEQVLPSGEIILRVNGSLEQFGRPREAAEVFVGGDERPAQVGALGGGQARQVVRAFPGGARVEPPVCALLTKRERGQRVGRTGGLLREPVEDRQRAVEVILLHQEVGHARERRRFLGGVESGDLAQTHDGGRPVAGRERAVGQDRAGRNAVGG